MIVRTLYPLLLGIAGFCVFACPLLGQDTIEVTLLGTGTPDPTLLRFGPSALVEIGDKTFLFDAGRGAMQRLSQKGTSYAEIDALFLTHLHSDHVVGIPDLWLTGWLLSVRDRPLQVFGPSGTADLIAGLTDAYAFDIGIRVSDDGVPVEGSRFEVTEIADGYEYQEEGIQIVAFDVDHRPVSPALGYRVNFDGKSILLSGDTRYSENLIANAAGVDLLIHEVTGANEEVLRNPFARRAFEHHTTAQESGEIFSKIQPELAVYSHLVLFDGYDLSQLILDTRQTYDGPLQIGEDMMVFIVGDEVEIREP